MPSVWIFSFLIALPLMACLDLNCLTEFFHFHDCTLREFSRRQNENAESRLREDQNLIEECFAGNGCPKPQFDRDPYADLPESLRIFQKELENLQSDVKQCVRMNSTVSYGDRLKRCLPKNDEISKLPSFTVALYSVTGSEISAFDCGVLDTDAGTKRMLAQKINMFRSIRSCSKSNPDAAENVLSCITGTRGRMQRDFCNVIQACTSNVTSFCKLQGARIVDSFCTCKQKLAQAQLETNSDVNSFQYFVQRSSNLAQSCFQKLAKPVPTVFASDQNWRLDENTMAVVKDIMTAETFGCECRACFTH